MRVVLPEEWSDFEFFEEWEFLCKCGKCEYSKRAYVSYDFVKLLDDTRRLANTKFVISNGCRCESYNTKVGGKPNSDHLVKHTIGKVCTGADIQVANDVTRYQMDNAFHQKQVKRIGVYDTFFHVGLGDEKTPALKWTPRSNRD